MLGHAHLMTGRPSDAVRTLEEGYRRLGEPQRAIPFLLLAYDVAGRGEAAKNLAARCAIQYPRLQLDGLCAPAKTLETTSGQPTRAPGETERPTATTGTSQSARGDDSSRRTRDQLKRAFGL
jgi:hypothetical protein